MSGNLGMQIMHISSNYKSRLQTLRVQRHTRMHSHKKKNNKKKRTMWAH